VNTIAEATDISDMCVCVCVYVGRTISVSVIKCTGIPRFPFI